MKRVKLWESIEYSWQAGASNAHPKLSVQRDGRKQKNHSQGSPEIRVVSHCFAVQSERRNWQKHAPATSNCWTKWWSHKA